MMIIGLAILFLIILFILSELWKKDNSLPKEGEEAMDSQPEAQKELSPRQRKKALKKELKRRQKEEDRLDKEQAKQELKDATRQLKAEAKERKKEKKRKRKEAKKRARTGGFIEDYNPIEAKEPQKKEKIQSVPEENVAADEANEFLKREIAATTEHLEEPGQVILDADIRQYIEKPSQAPQVEEEPKAEPAGPIHLAIPRYTEEELLQKAKEAGEDPVVLRDDVWGITLLDYSNIIIEGSEENS
jgi:membrane-bound lytic murein transglycosylase